ncbi:MAG: hypothetical protein WCC45_07240 [Paeniglutamicibacter sp.]
MNGVDWKSVPVAAPPPGAVEVPRSDFGFLAVAGILELGVPGAVYRLPREAGDGAGAERVGDSREIATTLADAGIPGPADPLADCWFILPPSSMPTEGFWDALEEAEPLRGRNQTRRGCRSGLHAALQVLYSSS